MSNIKKTIANIKWTKEQHPYSLEFDDSYYSTTNGYEETRYVFLKGNRLNERWNSLNSEFETETTFTIIETGFGTGLNFLATMKLWLKIPLHKDHRLHFISVEKYPLSKKQLKKCLSHWHEELATESQQLIDNYPESPAGHFTINFSRYNIKLTVMIESLDLALDKLITKKGLTIDAWFLDGFAPSKNPEMWIPKLYQTMKKLSSESATVATYTVAGVVKRGLNENGFSIKKIPGFANKREMLTAKLKE